MGRRVLILAAGIGSGHNIAAGVLESCFRAAPEVDAVQRLDILESTNEVYRTLYDDGYFALVEAAPWLVGWGYDANDPPFKLAHWTSLWDRINTTATYKAIRAFRPDIVVCTHFLPTRLVSLMLTWRSRGDTGGRHHRLRLSGTVVEQCVQSLLRCSGRDQGTHGRNRRAI